MSPQNKTSGLLLAIDAGNTNVVFAIYEGEQEPELRADHLPPAHGPGQEELPDPGGPVAERRR